MTDKIKNVFISHRHEDDEGLQKIKDLAAKHNMTIRDGSINKEKPNKAKDPDYIMNKIIKPRIDWASCLLVYVSNDTKNHEWVDREIEYASKIGKRIIGVWAYGEKDCELPKSLAELAENVVGWDSKNLVDAINGKDVPAEDPEGNQMPRNDIPRYSCGN